MPLAEAPWAVDEEEPHPTEIGTLDTRLSTQIAGVRTEIANLQTRLIRWMVGTVLATGGLTFGILRFLG